MPMLAPEASLAGPHTLAGRNNGNTPGRFFCLLRRLSIGAYYNIVFLALYVVMQCDNLLLLFLVSEYSQAGKDRCLL
jgi:hypothetical protein